MRPASLFLGLILLSASSLAAQVTGSYPSIAIMELSLPEAAGDEMKMPAEALADCLARLLRESQSYSRVVDRSSRQELLRRSGWQESSGSYEKAQLRAAAQLKVDLAVLGELKKSSSSYTLSLRLVDVRSGESLLREQYRHPSLDRLQDDCGRLASELQWASRRETLPPGDGIKPRERGVVAGFKAGQEGVSRAESIEGGSYLYAELSAELNRIFAASLRYSVCLFPAPFQDHLISVHSRINIRLAENLYSAISLAYLISTDYEQKPAHHVGLRLCPIYSGNMEGIAIELLPFSLFFDVESWRPVYMLELLSLGFWLPYQGRV